MHRFLRKNVVPAHAVFTKISMSKIPLNLSAAEEQENAEMVALSFFAGVCIPAGGLQAEPFLGRTLRTFKR